MSSSVDSHYVSILLCGSILTVIILVILIRCLLQRRSVHDEEEDDERQGLVTSNTSFGRLKKTHTFYQWNKTTPSCQTNPSKPETKSWEQRRTDLIQKYAAIHDSS
ncbi:hypothetical protein BDB01DRAFT_851437 [Pilobolus umbonatus]|nr:hypothetical protein BDB01DRAFT_851437 [Pilobolus umbonatus]